MTGHIPDATKKVLSPAAQAVLDAFSKDEGGVYLEDDPERLSFAIRELADQVVPKGGNFIAARIRDAILAIATELEGQ